MDDMVLGTQAVCSAHSTSFIYNHCYHAWVQTLSYIGLTETHFTDKETEIQRRLMIYP